MIIGLYRDDPRTCLTSFDFAIRMTTWCVTDVPAAWLVFANMQYVQECACTWVSTPQCACVFLCVHGWLPSLCLAFVARARALQFPQGHHCPCSPQPSGHRCSWFDTVLLTHTPHSTRCVGGQAGHPVACHTCKPLATRCVHVTLKGGSHCIYSFNPTTIHNETEVAPSGEGSYARGGVHKRIMGKLGVRG